MENSVTAKIINTTSVGKIDKGALTVTFTNTGGTAVTVAGDTLDAGDSETFPAIPGAVYREIDYDPQSSSLRIQETR
jgi:hypothetical protein